MDLTDLLGVGREPPAPQRPVCSRRGGTAPAGGRLEWNNPEIHAPERRKTWLASDEDREHLARFLPGRGTQLASRPAGAPGHRP
ncbi:hypothetical protein ACVB9L_10790, partial [Rothia kristinae]